MIIDPEKYIVVHRDRFEPLLEDLEVIARVTDDPIARNVLARIGRAMDVDLDSMAHEWVWKCGIANPCAVRGEVTIYDYHEWHKFPAEMQIREIFDCKHCGIRTFNPSETNLAVSCVRR